jgi:serine/threonine protein kinase
MWVNMGTELMSEDVMGDDIDTASTRPSAPRPVTSTLSATSGYGPSNTTLPVVHWSETGAVLEVSTLPRYEQIELLGEGGMGEVLRARDNDIGRDVAVKRLRPDLQHPELFARFVEEVRTIGQLEHPNIVPIHDAGLDAQGYFFVMKHVEGESLASLITRLDAGDLDAHIRWPIERRVDIVRKVLEALRYAHSRGVIHRDIKPANILVGPMGEVFLLDWGIAKRDRHTDPSHAPSDALGDTTHTRMGSVMGTPLYMSPEQARGAPADARSDIYSLCMTLYELATLKHPFAHIRDTATLLKAVQTMGIPHAATRRHKHQQSTSMDLSWVIKKGLSKDPAERYQSADELIRRFDDRAKGKVPIQCHITATKRLVYESLRLVDRFPAAFTLSAVAAIGGVAYLLLR